MNPEVDMARFSPYLLLDFDNDRNKAFTGFGF
jgi:hypothetical protein